MIEGGSETAGSADAAEEGVDHLNSSFSHYNVPPMFLELPLQSPAQQYSILSLEMPNGIE